MPNKPAAIIPGMLALHGNRLEALAQTLAAWLRQRPLEALEPEIVLVQSNGMAEWFKMELAQTLGVSAAVRVELPGRFIWSMYRQALGGEQVPRHTPLDKPAMLWNLMELLPRLAASGEPLWQPVRDMLAAQPGADSAEEAARYFLALRMADLLDQYQVYRPDWLTCWENGQDILPRHAGQSVPDAACVPQDARWQPALWRALLARLSGFERQAIRPHLHRRALAALAAGDLPENVRLPRRVLLFGMTHMPAPLLELLSALSAHGQVLLGVPNPCRFYWSDALDGRELFQQQARQQRHANRRQTPLAELPLEHMHAHAHPLLLAWGRQVRDTIRQLEAFDEAERAQQRMGLLRIDFFDEDEPADASLLAQVQNRIRDLTPLAEHARRPVAAHDQSILFRVAHSPMREVEILHDHLLDHFQHSTPQQGLQPRDVIVMVPDIAQYAGVIQAVFGQYPGGDARHIPFDIADLGAQAASPLLKAVEWLVRLPGQRAALSELGDLLAVPAVAQRFGLDGEAVAQLQAWMQGCGIRWGLDAAHRDSLGLPGVGEQNTSWFGLQRMLLGFASGAQAFDGIEPYQEIGGLAAAHVGALAQVLHLLHGWQSELGQSASPGQWGERWRRLLADFVQPASEDDRVALALLHDALQDWLASAADAGFADRVPLAVARHAWLHALQGPAPMQRFHAGGVTFCTLLPMRAIPFKLVCLLGMNDGDYPRKSLRQDMDLMAQPGQTRPGDRSRAQDDRQLMLEALLSARAQLYISWVGRSVRDNTPRPPSVLVAQLRDYLGEGWGAAVVDERTQEHPLQAFNARYFEQGGNLRTWAAEWLPAHQPEFAPAAVPVQAAPDADHLNWTLAELGSFWRNPAQLWFERRLQVRFTGLPELAQDHEPLSLQGLERWEHGWQLIQALHPLAAQGASHAQLRAAAERQLQRLQRAGALPLHGAGAALQAQWLQELDFLLLRWAETLQEWREAGEPRRLQLAHRQQPQWRVQDWLHGLRQSPRHAHALRLQVMPGTLIDKPASSKTPVPALRLHALAPQWLHAVASAARQHCHQQSAPPVHSRVIGMDACLDIMPLSQDTADRWLDDALALAAKGLRQPLPMDIRTGLAWLQALGDSDADPSQEQWQKAYAAAQMVYDGGPYQAAQVQRNPYLARLYPDFASLWQSSAFEELAHAMLAPIRQWATHNIQVTEAAPAKPLELAQAGVKQPE